MCCGGRVERGLLWLFDGRSGGDCASFCILLLLATHIVLDGGVTGGFGA